MQSFFVLLTLVLAAAVPSGARPDFDPGKASFAVVVRGETVPYREFAITVLPALRSSTGARRIGLLTMLSKL